MGRKKVIQKQPIEKLSSDAIVEITEDSSSEEEADLTTPIIKPKTKKPRTAKQLANDQKLRDRKKKKVEPVVDEMDISTHPVKQIPVAESEDKPLTKKEMLELMSQMNTKPAPVKKPRKPRATKVEMAKRKAEKVIMETSTPVAPPPPALVRSKPEMLFV
ncbi:MAG: hypothetical protein CMI60_21315 [Parvibaculum sp.]|nr:hypothetical protein [Parvibaculum sp.]